MSYLESVNKITRDAMRRVAKLARQRISNAQNQSASWNGYNASGQAVVKVAGGRSYAVEKLNNTGQKKGTEMQLDTANSVVKARRLPPGEEEAKFPQGVKYNLHFFALKRSDGACVAIRVRERIGTYSLAGSLSQNDVEEILSASILVDAVVVNYGATTDIVGEFTKFNEVSYNKLFKSREIFDYISANEKGLFRDLTTAGGVVESNLVEDVRNYSIYKDYDGHQLEINSPIIFRPWGRGLVMGAGEVNGSTDYSDGYVTRRLNEGLVGYGGGDDMVGYFLNVNLAQLSYNNVLGSLVSPSLDTWNYLTNVLSVHKQTWSDEAEVYAKCKVVKFDETGGEKIFIPGDPNPYVKHMEYFFKYQVDVCEQNLLKFAVTIVDDNYSVPNGINDAYRLRKFTEDFDMEGPWVTKISGGYKDIIDPNTVPKPNLSDLISQSTYSSPSIAVTGGEHRDPSHSSFSSTHPNRSPFVTFQEFTKAEAASTRYWTPKVLPGIYWPNTKFDTYIGLSPYRISSRNVNEYYNAPTGCSEGFGRAFVTLNPSYVVTEAYYEEPDESEDLEYYRNEEFFVTRTRAQRVPVDINVNNETDPPITYNKSAFQKLSATPGVIELVDSDSADEPFFVDVESRPAYRDVPIKPRHDFVVHVLNEQTGAIDSYPQSVSAPNHESGSWEWHAPEICVELYGNTFWLTRGTVAPEVAAPEFEVPIPVRAPILYEGLEYPRPISFHDFEVSRFKTREDLAIVHVREVTRTRSIDLNQPIDQELVEWHTVYRDSYGNLDYTVRMGTLDDFRYKTFSKNELGQDIRIKIGDLVDSKDHSEYKVLRNYRTQTKPNAGAGSVGKGELYFREKEFGEYWNAADMNLTDGFAKSTRQTHKEIVLYFDQRRLYLCEAIGEDFGDGLADLSINNNTFNNAVFDRVEYYRIGFNDNILETLAIQPHNSFVNSFNGVKKDNEFFDLVALPHTRSLNRLFEQPQDTAMGALVRIGQI